MTRILPSTIACKFGILFIALLLVLSPAAATARAGPPAPASSVSCGLPAPVGPAACDPNWVVVPSANSSTTENYLEAVAAVGPDDVWAVGSYWQPSPAADLPLLEHWTGTSWAAVTAPAVGTEHHLYGVAAAAPGDVWAVGDGETGSLLQTLTLHLSGSTWSVMPSPNPGAESGNGSLQAVTAIAPNDVWAVGWYFNSTTGRNETLTMHWNGTEWSVVTSPNLGDSRNEFYGVAASGPNDVWAVGYYSAGRDRNLIEHWNGTAWSVVPTPDLSPDDHNNLLGVAVAGANDAWAVGRAYVASNETTVVEHWNGAAWSIISSPNVPQAGNHLEAVAVAAPNSVYAVGSSYQSGGNETALIEHWNGTSWSIVTSANVGTSGNILVGVTAAASNPDDVWAVGHANDGSSTPEVTMTLHYHPCAPSCTIQFSDVPSSSPFYPYIHCLACKGIVSGYGDTFRPANPVTRGQMAKFIANAANYTDTIPSGVQTFSDVPPSSPFYLYVERVYRHGIISGYADHTFKPTNNVTRGQTAKFVANAMHYTDPIPPTQQTFLDVVPGSAFHVYVEQVYLHGIVSGYADGTFKPSNDVTRAQVSKFVANAFFPSCAVTNGAAKR